MTDVAVDYRADTKETGLVVCGSETAIQRWTEGGAVPDGVRFVEAGTAPVAGLAQGVPNRIVWLGWPDADTTALIETGDTLWVLVDAIDLAELRSRRGPEIMDQVARLAQAHGVLVADAAGLEYLSVRTPAHAAKFYGMCPGDSFADAIELVRLAGRVDEAPALLLHRPHRSGVRAEVTSSSMMVHELCEEIEHLDESPAGARHLLGASDEHRSDGLIRPRNAAWHLASAVNVMGESVLITDDLDVAVVLAGYKSLDAQMWVLLSTQQVHQLTDPNASQHAELDRGLRAVLARGGSIAVCDEASREELRDTPGLGSRVVLIGKAGEIDLQLTWNLARTVGRNWSVPDGTCVLLAGHDFKFAGELVQVLEQVKGVRIEFDQWEHQNRQSVSQSDRLLREANVILCEFASHNAVWYSWHKRPGQRLVVHFHGYELFQDWITEINVKNVDVFVFVSEFYRDKVVRELGWPLDKTAVVPNMIDVDDLDRPKDDGARFHLGIAGIVPALKRPDRALDVLEQLLEKDERYVLHVRGRHPWEYQWMWREPVVRDAYESFYERLSENPRLLQHVAFDAFGPDMGRWFRRIGWMLSPSYRETFHLAPVEGMPGGAVPVVWQRDGAEEIFSERWVHESTEEAARFILSVNAAAEMYMAESQRARAFASRYSTHEVAPSWIDIMFGAGPENLGLDERFTTEELGRRYAQAPAPAALDRLLLLLLKKDRDVDAARALMAEYPKQALSASRETKELIEHLAAESDFAAAVARRPMRCEGALYQVRRGTALVIDQVQELKGPAVSIRTLKDGVVEEVVSLPRGTEATHLVQIVADAVVRAARLHRPEALVSAAPWESSWPTVIAARRLGVPAVLIEDERADERSPATEEFDAFANRVDDVTEETIRTAAQVHRRLSHRDSSPALSDLTVGIIADEFTRRTVSGRCRTVTIHRKDAYLQVASAPLDVLFIESAWGGPDNEWFHGVAFYKDERQDIEQVVKVARARNIPVVFWNKEDPVHFRSFAPTATLCDAVFTTDADRIPAYLDHGKSEGSERPWVAASLPFYAEPRLHNPLPGTWDERKTISYAGTYYGQRYAERSAELDGILARAAGHGLTIYDRQLNHPNSPYHFPDHYGRFIEGGLSYDEVLEAYKAHPVHINVNSVNDSPTMFSRRVVEIAASGAVVVSGRGRGINRTIPEIPASEDVNALDEFMGTCLTDPDAWARQVWLQLRAVRRAHLADQALTLMFRSAGIPVKLDPATRWSARVGELDEHIVASLLEQTVLPVAVEFSSCADTRVLVQLEEAGIDTSAPTGEHWITDWSSGLPPTWAEDLLYATRFCPEEVSVIGARRHRGEASILSWDAPPEAPAFFRRTGPGPNGRTLVWLLPAESFPSAVDSV